MYSACCISPKNEISHKANKILTWKIETILAKLPFSFLEMQC